MCRVCGGCKYYKYGFYPLPSHPRSSVPLGGRGKKYPPRESKIMSASEELLSELYEKGIWNRIDTINLKIFFFMIRVCLLWKMTRYLRFPYHLSIRRFMAHRGMKRLYDFYVSGFYTKVMLYVPKSLYTITYAYIHDKQKLRKENTFFLISFS